MVQKTVTLTDADGDHEYEPFIVGHHTGGDDEGHYTLCYKEYATGGLWYEVDDEEVSLMKGIPACVVGDGHRICTQYTQDERTYLTGDENVCFVVLIRKSVIKSFVQLHLNNLESLGTDAEASVICMSSVRKERLSRLKDVDT